MGGKLDEDLKALVRYYGEDSSSTKPEEVFGIIGQFSSALLVRPLSSFDGKVTDLRCSELKGKFERRIRN